jgi:hypothetical protein
MLSTSRTLTACTLHRAPVRGVVGDRLDAEGAVRIVDRHMTIRRGQSRRRPPRRGRRRPALDGDPAARPGEVLGERRETLHAAGGEHDAKSGLGELAAVAVLMPLLARVATTARLGPLTSCCLSHDVGSGSACRHAEEADGQRAVHADQGRVLGEEQFEEIQQEVPNT